MDQRLSAVMFRLFCTAVGLQLLATSRLAAQNASSWKAVGDPSGAPPGCSRATGISAINAFFAAMREADSTRLVRGTTALSHGQFVFSTGKFTTSDTFVRANTIAELLSYARQRARQHERMTVQQVTFNYWRGHRLGFGPIYFLRSADDLGNDARAGIGKGEYWCGKGIAILNTAPRPSFDPGPGQ